MKKPSDAEKTKQIAEQERSFWERAMCAAIAPSLGPLPPASTAMMDAKNAAFAADFALIEWRERFKN